MSARHSLTDKNLETRTATCSVDGAVKIRKSGTGWVCAEKAKANVRASLRKNPNRDRTSKTEHKLGWKSAELLSGECVKCGPVDIVANGRGYMCAVRAKELGRVNPQDAPATYCRDCMVADGVLVWLTGGDCRRCAETDLNAMFAKTAADERLFEGLTSHMDEDDWKHGIHLEGVIANPEWMPEYESAVPGWRTLGTRV